MRVPPSLRLTSAGLRAIARALLSQRIPDVPRILSPEHNAERTVKSRRMPGPANEAFLHSIACEFQL